MISVFVFWLHISFLNFFFLNFSFQWGPNISLLCDRVLRYPDRVRNLYFTYLFVLRAVTKVSIQLRASFFFFFQMPNSFWWVVHMNVSDLDIFTFMKLFSIKNYFALDEIIMSSLNSLRLHITWKMPSMTLVTPLRI